MEGSEGSEEVERRVDSQVVSMGRRGMCNTSRPLRGVDVADVVKDEVDGNT
jgi:hypothetical protein